MCVGAPIPQAPLVASLGSRYISVTPQPAGSVAPVALRLTSPDWPCLDKYINTSGLLVTSPFSQVPDAWGTVVVHGADIIPSSTYTIVAECGVYASTTGSAATALWADTVGFYTGTEWTPPDGVVDVIDVMAILDKFQNLATAPPIEWVDLVGVGPTGIGCDPDQLIDILDAMVAVDAFQGVSYGDSTRCPVPCP